MVRSLPEAAAVDLRVKPVSGCATAPNSTYKMSQVACP